MIEKYESMSKEELLAEVGRMRDGIKHILNIQIGIDTIIY